ncbi:MAG TPA: hypothetical protein VHL77_00385, partial [Ferruginibacter sp.]|nr:hypothetical protein [Ferruginibacter sp.]
MKRFSVILLTTMLLSHAPAFSQKPRPVAKPKPASPAVKKITIRDTLAYNIQTTINELNAYITDNGTPVQVMAGDYTGTDQYDSPRYLALVKVPGSAQNLLTKQSIDRYHKTEKWEWKSILLSAAKDQYPASMFVSLKTKVDSIIKAMPAIRESNEVNSILNVYIYENVSDSRYRDLYKADEMGIQVQFIKP